MPPKSSIPFQSRKPKIQIVLPTKKDSYTTNDRIDGYATVTAQSDTSFTSIDIQFVGSSRTQVDRSLTAAGERRSGAVHRFLKLRQPGVSLSLPRDYILRANEEYTIPFEFTVPSELLPQSCKHKKESMIVEDAHLQLPPSLSDCEGRADRLAPVMADIQYGVLVQIHGRQDKVDPLITSRLRSIWLSPTTIALPPTYETRASDESKLHMAKTIKCAPYGGNHGTVTAVTSEPAPLDLNNATGGTFINLSLRYDQGKCKNATFPPEVHSISTTLEGTTYYSTSGQQTFPSRAAWASDQTLGMYNKSIKLASMSSSKVAWESSCYSGGRTASLQVPITLDSDKIIVPTFHSCLISRVYHLQIRLKFKGSGMSTGIELRVPLQIIRERDGSVEYIVKDEKNIDYEFCEYAEPAPMYCA